MIPSTSLITPGVKSSITKQSNMGALHQSPPFLVTASCCQESFEKKGSVISCFLGRSEPCDKILMPRPAITTFLSVFRGKTAQKARRRRFFLENSQLSSNFQAFLVFAGGVITPLGKAWGGVITPLTPPVDPCLTSITSIVQLRVHFGVNGI